MGQAFAQLTSQPPLPENPPVPPPIGRLPNLSAEEWKKLAAQSRPMLPPERQVVMNRMGGAFNPDAARVAYDAGISGTNLRGWVDAHGKMPTVVFLPTDDSNDPNKNSFPHEATHVWQNLAGGQNTSHYIPLGEYDYKDDPSQPISAYGPDQQAEMVQDSVPRALEFLKQHPIPYTPRADVAFLDSVRSAYDTSKKLDDPDFKARIGALGGISAVTRKGGRLRSQKAFGGE